jgi:hypothetical protein
MYKILYFLISFFLFNFSVQAEQKVSGLNYSNIPGYFETNDIISFGKIVIGKVNSSNFENNSSTKYRKTAEYIYFCGFKELYEYSSTYIYYKQNGEFDNSNTTKSSNETMPISLEKSNDITHKIWGTQIFVEHLDKKCSNINKKFPRIEIPFARGVTTIDHILLDTFTQNKNIKSAWVKQSYTLSEKILDSSNKPIKIDGSDLTAYTIDNAKGTTMVNTVVDCDKDLIGTKETIIYNVKGEVINSSKNNSKSVEMNSSVPNSIGEITKEFFCKL